MAGCLIPVVVVCCAVRLGPFAPLHAQVQEPIGAFQRVIERDAAPAWIALPPYGQAQFPYGVKLDLVHAVVISRSDRREAVLVGAFRNRGEELHDAAIALHYLDAEGAAAGPAGENAAAVSAIPRDALLPFRFPLIGKDALTGAAAFYRLVVQASTEPGPRSTSAGRATVTSTRWHGRGQGVSVTGTLDADALQGLHPDIVLTVLLLDEQGQVLDVVAERPFGSAEPLPAQGPWPFEIRTVMPVSKPVKDVKVWAVRR